MILLFESNYNIRSFRAKICGDLKEYDVNYRKSIKRRGLS
jgi:hypothetical protein